MSFLVCPDLAKITSCTRMSQIQQWIPAWSKPDDDDDDVFPAMLNEKPIYCVSHKFSDTQTRWFTSEKEACVILIYHFGNWTIICITPGLWFGVTTRHWSISWKLQWKIEWVLLGAFEVSRYYCQKEYIPGNQNTCCEDLWWAPATGRQRRCRNPWKHFKGKTLTLTLVTQRSTLSLMWEKPTYRLNHKSN